jgi:hypothetical protein
MEKCILLDRALKLHRARHPQRHEAEFGPLGDKSDPNHAPDIRPYLKGAPSEYTELIAARCDNKTSSRDYIVPVAEVVWYCTQQLLEALAYCDDDVMGIWQQREAEIARSPRAVLSLARVAVFHRCQMLNFLVSSELSSRTLAREGKSEAGSYCIVQTRDELGRNKLEPAFVRYFIMINWHHGGPNQRVAVVCPIPYGTDDDECAAFGQTVFRFDRSTDLQAGADIMVPVENVRRPLILIKTPAYSQRCMWRLIQFQGKLLGTFDQSDYW